MGGSKGVEPSPGESQSPMLTVTPRATFKKVPGGMLTYFGFTYLKEPKSTKGAQPVKMAAAIGNAPTYQVLQTCANLSQLNSEKNIGMAGFELAISSSQNWRLNRWATSR
jgi:hypothetical protein